MGWPMATQSKNIHTLEFEMAMNASNEDHEARDAGYDPEIFDDPCGVLTVQGR